MEDPDPGPGPGGDSESDSDSSSEGPLSNLLNPMALEPASAAAIDGELFAAASRAGSRMGSGACWL